jgi:hypothetical protein
VSYAYPLTCDNQTKRDRIARINTRERATPLFADYPMCLLLGVAQGDGRKSLDHRDLPGRTDHGPGCAASSQRLALAGGALATSAWTATRTPPT